MTVRTHPITVLVVGYNSKEWLRPCLSTLATASDSRLQLCFVDNHNNPGLARLDLSAFELEVLKTPYRMGFAEANNFGLVHTRFRSKLLVLLNQDTISTRGWIDQCASLFESDCTLGIISPGLRTYDFSGWEPNLVACMRDCGMEMSLLEAGGTGLAEVRQTTAAAMVIRMSVLKEVGPFDPIFGSYYEDYDLCRRVREAGYRVGVCSAARVGHFSGSASTDSAAIKRRSRAIIRNRLIHRVRENSPHRLSVLINHLLRTLPNGIIRGLVGTETSQPILATLLAHWDLLWVADRLISNKRDKKAWSRFLMNIGWPARSTDAQSES